MSTDPLLLEMEEPFEATRHDGGGLSARTAPSSTEAPGTVAPLPQRMSRRRVAAIVAMLAVVAVVAVVLAVTLYPNHNDSSSSSTAASVPTFDATTDPPADPEIQFSAPPTREFHELGYGFDTASGEVKAEPIFKMTKASTPPKGLHLSSHSTLPPTEAVFNFEPSSSAQVSLEIFEDYRSYVRSHTDDYGISFLPGMLSGYVGFNEQRTEYSGSEKKRLRARSHRSFTVASATLKRGTELDPSFEKELDKLPRNPDSDEDHRAYDEFFWRFGTHYVDSTTYGGSVSLEISVDAESYTTSGKSKEQFMAGLKFLMLKKMKFKGELSTGDETDYNNYREEFHVSSKCDTVGGDISLFDRDIVDSNAWTTSIKASPAVIRKSLKPFKDLASDLGDFELRSALDRETKRYLLACPHEAIGADTIICGDHGVCDPASKQCTCDSGSWYTARSNCTKKETRTLDIRVKSIVGCPTGTCLFSDDMDPRVAVTGTRRFDLAECEDCGDKYIVWEDRNHACVKHCNKPEFGVGGPVGNYEVGGPAKVKFEVFDVDGGLRGDDDLMCSATHDFRDFLKEPSTQTGQEVVVGDDFDWNEGENLHPEWCHSSCKDTKLVIYVSATPVSD